MELFCGLFCNLNVWSLHPHLGFFFFLLNFSVLEQFRCFSTCISLYPFTLTWLLLLLRGFCLNLFTDCFELFTHLSCQDCVVCCFLLLQHQMLCVKIIINKTWRSFDSNKRISMNQ
jgi:hypothetical protein